MKLLIKGGTMTKEKTKTELNKDLHDSLLELIRITSTVIPDDVQRVIMKALKSEKKNTSAKYAMDIIDANIKMAKMKSQPICQDTGTIVFKVYHPAGFSQLDFRKVIEKAVIKATKLGYLRQNSVNSLTGKNDCMNVGGGHPQINFIETKKNYIDVKLMLKGGGCENVGAQYAMPYTTLDAGRDLAGVRKVILDAIQKAQGKGCGPGTLGVCIGGDRASGYAHAKEQLLRTMDDENPIKELENLKKILSLQLINLELAQWDLVAKQLFLVVRLVLSIDYLPLTMSLSHTCVGHLEDKE